MKLKKITAVLLSAAVTLGCAQTYAAEVSPTEDGIVSDTGGTDNGGGETTEPSETPAEETWTANPVYNEETGFLTWDEYTGAKDALFVTYSAIINDGEGDTYTMYLPDRAACLPFYVAKQSQDGEEGEPWTINGDCEVRVVADPFYEDESTDDNYVITSSDYFYYTFNGGTINPDLPIPVVTEGTLGSPYEESDGITAVPVHAVFQEGTYGNIGVLYKLTYNGTETIDCDYGIYRTCPEGKDHYCCHTNITYGETGEVYVQACSVGIDGSQSEWSEPYLLTAPANPDIPEGTWNANFVYNEETGILSWDDIINSDEEFFYGIYIISSHATGRIHRNSSGAGEWGDSRLDVPNINLPLCLASLSYDSDFTGEIHVSVKICPADNDEFVYYKSADSGVVFTYDGRDVNTELEVPSLKVYGGKVKWNLTEGAIGYLYSKDGEKPFGFSSMPADVNEFTLSDDVNSIAVCSVDKNGDVSEWSELVSVSDPNPDVPEGTWNANFFYDENTGVLYWDKPLVAEVDDNGNSIVSMVNYSVIVNGDVEFPAYDFTPANANDRVIFNLPLNLAEYNANNDEPLSGDMEIRVRLDTEVDFITEPVCVDSFSYTFEGKEGTADIGVPEITGVETELTDAKFHAFHLTAKMNEIENAIGYLMKFDNARYANITSSSYDDWDNGVKNWWYVPSDDKDTVRICAVDKNGSTGKWSEPFEFESPIWNANFRFDEESGELSWDGCPNAEEKAEGYVHYTMYAENSDGEVTSIWSEAYDKSMFGSSYSMRPGYSMRNLKKGSYKLYITAVCDTWSDSASNVAGLSDIYTYDFKGGEVNPDLKAPLLKNAYAYQDDDIITEFDGYFYTADGSSFAGDGVEMRLLADGKNTDIVRSFGCSSLKAIAFSFEINFYDWVGKGAKELSAQLRLIDKDGSYSEWSEPQPFTVKSSFTNENGFYNKVFNSTRASYKYITVNIGNDGNIACGTQQNIYLPGVKYSWITNEEPITVSELKDLFKGVTVTNFEFLKAKVNGSPTDITFDDLFYGVVVQTKDKDGNDRWNPKYFDFTMDFDETLTELNVGDDETVTNVLFQYGVKAETIERLGLKQGDYVELFFKTDKTGENSFTYEETADGLVITGGTINDPNVVIPSEIGGKPVVEIGANAFYFNGDIETLVISENVKRIDWYAFNTCENLAEVTLPESLEYIDDWAFERCSSLKTVTIPKNTSHVGSGAFAQNTSMTSINCDTANSAYVSVDGVLFTKDMRELTAYPCGRSGGYTVPESVNHIGNAAFYGAKKLSSVEISGALDFIGFEAFAECELLSNVNINDGVNYVGYWAFRGCTGIKQLTVPQSVTNIGDQAFGFKYADNKYDDFSLRGYKDSSVYYYAIRHDIPFVIIGDADKENSPFKEENSVEEPVASDPSKAEEDSITSITVNPAFNMKNKNETGVGIDLSKIKIKAEEIYQDEESIRRAEEALGDVIKGNKHYNLLDLTLLYDGEDFSNGYDGLIKVIIPIPAGHRDKEFYCYRIVDNNGTPEKELIPGKRVEDSYIIYLEHFSTYAFVGDGDHEHSFSKSYESDDANHWHECSCGEISDAAAHTASEPITENGVKYTECTVCGRILGKDSDTDTPETPSNPTTESGSGTFVIPDTTTESATAETSAPSSETTAPQAAADNTDTSSDGTKQEIVSDNNTDGNAGGNTGSTDSTGNGTANEDKNQNTGVTLAGIPVLAAAAGIIFLKKRK